MGMGIDMEVGMDVEMDFWMEYCNFYSLMVKIGFPWT